MTLKTNKLQIVVIAMLMAIATSCKSMNPDYLLKAFYEREAPITFVFDGTTYSKGTQLLKTFWGEGKFENNYSPYNEIGYEIYIKREGFTNPSNNKKAVLFLLFINETENSIVIDKPYPLHNGSNVALYYTDYYDDTTEIYYAKNGTITFTEIQQVETSFGGKFEFTTVNENNVEKKIEGTFENLSMRTYGCLDVMDSGKVVFTI